MVKVDDIIYFYDEYERVEKGKIRSVEKRYVTVSINQTWNLKRIPKCEIITKKRKYTTSSYIV